MRKRGRSHGLLLRRPGATALSQAKRAVQRGATAVIFDVSENPEAIDQVSSWGQAKAGYLGEGIGQGVPTSEEQAGGGTQEAVPFGGTMLDL